MIYHILHFIHIIFYLIIILHWLIFFFFFFLFSNVVIKYFNNLITNELKGGIFQYKNISIYNHLWSNK